MTIEALALSVCIISLSIALATHDQQVAACNAQQPTVQAAQLRQAQYLLAPK